jgi:hypothetical protein
MAMNLTNLDPKTRSLMVKEIDLDIAGNRLYMSRRLSATGQTQYPALLKQAAQAHDAAWLAQQLRSNALLQSEETKHTPSGGTTVAKVPVTAPDTLADGEFNRFYCRGVCARAVEEGKPTVRVYRARAVSNPRPESQAKIGATVDASQLLQDLRNSPGVEPALGIPPGPNSGLSIQLV